MTIRRRQVRGIIVGGAIAINSYLSRGLWRALCASSSFTDNYRIGLGHAKGQNARRGIESDYGSIRYVSRHIASFAMKSVIDR
ncbi:hypothetical protein DBV15_04985 [Temnothorax longispinosus]|uniref:Uncharacterized protein n=1 Tax=Temnothorax longispinosus TaxID=300112 RepID=A0A4S2KPI9_9HYME|nr:hypothetical protein DBV15_04985 [Temnothorax longispinosus]